MGLVTDVGWAVETDDIAGQGSEGRPRQSGLLGPAHTAITRKY